MAKPEKFARKKCIILAIHQGPAGLGQVMMKMMQMRWIFSWWIPILSTGCEGWLAAFRSTHHSSSQGSMIIIQNQSFDQWSSCRTSHYHHYENRLILIILECLFWKWCGLTGDTLEPAGARQPVNAGMLLVQPESFIVVLTFIVLVIFIQQDATKQECN